MGKLFVGDGRCTQAAWQPMRPSLKSTCSEKLQAALGALPNLSNFTCGQEESKGRGIDFGRAKRWGATWLKMASEMPRSPAHDQNEAIVQCGNGRSRA